MSPPQTDRTEPQAEEDFWALPPEEYLRLRQNAEDHFWRSQAAAERAGDPVWFLEDELLPAEIWALRGQETWLQLRTDRLPGAHVLVRLGVTPDGLACTGLLVERGRGEVTARDLRLINLRPLLDVALAPMRKVLVHQAPATRPARPGNVGYDLAHWRDVHERYQRARQADRRRFVQVMLGEYPEGERPSEATMRRWVKRVEALVESGDLP